MSDDTAPSINYLVPDKVPRNWEGTLVLHDAGFDEDGFPLIDAAAPGFVVNCPSLVSVAIKKETTSVAGKKIVEFHAGSGAISNQIEWSVY